MCVISTILDAFLTTMVVSMRNVVGPRIREARYRPGQRVTQEQLAARLQSQGIAIDRSAISKIEAGKRPVTDLEIISICDVLGIKVATLFGEE